MQYLTLLLCGWVWLVVEGDGDFTNDFAVELFDDNPDVVDLVAQSHGCRKIRKIAELGKVFHFKHEQLHHRTKRAAVDILNIMKNDPNIKRVEQQQLLSREKRHLDGDEELDRIFKEMQSDESKENNIKPVYNPNLSDPLFSDQWYLWNTGQAEGPPNLDVNVLRAWQMNYTGSGVVVTILDDGLEHTHPDIKPNYDPDASGDLNDEDDTDHDPMPDESDTSNSHGTKCAGEVAAVANNSICGVGIAFNAKIGGVRILDGRVTDLLEARAINYAYQHIDIYSASWGPRDNGKTMEAPGTFCSEALRKGVQQGRNGKGSLFVWATGNGGANGDDCGADGYVSSIYTLSVGSINEKGTSTYFSEVCPSTMAVIYTGGAHVRPGQPGYKRPHHKVISTDIHSSCTKQFQGTSSAAPLGAGCVALALQANPSLTWRDVQHLVVSSARMVSPEEGGWVLNGAGIHVNHRFGFGAMDCSRMVKMAQTFQHVSAQHICPVSSQNSKQAIKSGGTISQVMSTDGCLDDKDTRIDRLEHVEVVIHLEHSYRGDIVLQITSPSGTKSEVLSLRPQDDSQKGINFKFMTVHNWGEHPAGEWALTVTDSPSSSRKNTGTLLSWSLILYGSWSGDVASKKKEKFTGRSQDDKKRARDLSETEVKNIMERESEVSKNLDIRYNRGLGSDSDESVSSQGETEKDNRLSDRDYLLNVLGKYVKSEERETSKRNDLKNEKDAQNDIDLDDKELYNMLVRYLEEKEKNIKKKENCESDNSCTAQEKRKTFSDEEINELLEILKNLQE